MTRFERVIQILDTAIGGPGVNIGVHGAFWRGISRDVFVAKKVQGLDLLVLGNGAGSNLVKSLKGESPFGQDLDNPPPGARFDRMPSGLPPVPDGDIVFIRRWIDDRCPEDAFVPDTDALSWRPTNAPVASSRTDDIWFTDPQTGWAVNSNGQIVMTADGGTSWTVQFHDPEVYFRCIGFANPNRGWAGTLTKPNILFETKDGGTTWAVVSNLPANAPSAVCGMSVVSDQVVYASGTNFPNRPPRMMKTTDGGSTWTAWEMRPWASILIDTFFTSPTRGWVVGGKTEEPVPSRTNVTPVVLFTEDGGATWVNRAASIQSQFPMGEWGWKIQFLDDRVGFVSLENFNAGAILKTTDGGLSWTRLPINDPQKNANLEGVGFIDPDHGWVGGWGDAQFQRLSSSRTVDGGLNWTDADEIGKALNRFRFFGKPVTVGYASGQTVYKYSAQPVGPAPAAMAAGPRLIADALVESATPGLSVEVPRGAKKLAVRIWDRFGDPVATPVDETNPAPGPRTIPWDGKGQAGQVLEPGYFIVRATVDDRSESRLVRLSPSRLEHPVPFSNGSHQMTSSHVAIPGSRRRLLPGSRLMGHCDPDQRIELTLKLRRKAPLPPANGRPAVPMSRQDVAATYGAAEDDIAKVKAAMQRSGIEVHGDDQASRSVQVAGPIKVFEDLFQVKLFEYAHASKDYRGRTGMVHVPEQLDGIITAVYGLDNRRVINRRRRPRPALDDLPATTESTASQGFFPAQLAEAYHFPPGDGTGEVIGILEFGGGYLPDDLSLYCRTVGVPMPKVKPVSVDRSPTDTDDGAAGEVMLDIEVIAGACPGATQVVYFGSTNFDEKAWVDALGKAIHDRDNEPFILSISWGNSEDSNAWQEGTIGHINDTFHEATMMGITICVAAGDDGSADETDDGQNPGELDGMAHVDFPAASPFVLAVGGTDLRISRGGTTEVTWKDGNGRRFIPPSGTGTGGSTGGGVSSMIPRPDFQGGIAINSVNPGGIVGRVVPDVAAHAESNGRTTGYYWVLDGQGGPNGGTSAAAPLWASLIARINAVLQKEKGPGKRAGYLTPVLYQAGTDGQPIGSSACKDIVSGDNISAAVGGYSAGPGYDAVTGWGSPIGSKLLDALRAIV